MSAPETMGDDAIVNAINDEVLYAKETPGFLRAMMEPWDEMTVMQQRHAKKILAAITRLRPSQLPAPERLDARLADIRALATEARCRSEQQHPHLLNVTRPVEHQGTSALLANLASGVELLLAHVEAATQTIATLEKENARLVEAEGAAMLVIEQQDLDAKRRDETIAALRGAVTAACATIELGDQRLLASDGPAGGRPPDLSLAEWRSLYETLDAAMRAGEKL